jgi:acyl-CoA synthetase (NDP forming)
MPGQGEISVFLEPSSVAVIGATARVASWGSFIMGGLLSLGYKGQVYPVNHKAQEVYGLKAFKDIREIPGPVDLAVFTIPEEYVWEAVKACGEKGVKGITLITAGYGEATVDGKIKELEVAALARSYGIRILGPNVSGTFNLHKCFNAAASHSAHLYPTSLAAACQGGFAFYELLASAHSRRMGVGKFIHTGNESDLTVTDFLEYYGSDPDVKGILMYLETIRDGDRFMDIARKVTREKPVIAFKAGQTEGGARAANSHTGALAGRREIFHGILTQAGILIAPAMELLLPAGHALIERPPLRGRRIGVITMGGSWGVVLTDSLEEHGLSVKELSRSLQVKLRELGMPIRASTKNPIDAGAAGHMIAAKILPSVAKELAYSGEVDAIIVHGIGIPGMHNGSTPHEMFFFLEIEKQLIEGFTALEKEACMPILIGNHYSPWESQAIYDLNKKGIRTYNRIDDISCILKMMHQYWSRR